MPSLLGLLKNNALALRAWSSGIILYIALLYNLLLKILEM